MIMTSQPKSSQRRLSILSLSNSITAGSSGSPLLQSSNPDSDRRCDGDDNNNNNHSASAFLMKLLDSKHLSNDLDASPSGFNDSDLGSYSYSMKTNSSNTRSSMSQRSSTSHKKNRSSHSHKNSPAEVFRKDLISAMKIPDTSQLLHEEYWVMQDPWKMDWEKGVQVPVNQKGIPQKSVRVLSKETHGDFRMPRKMVKSSPEPGDKDMVDVNVLASSTCRYDLDELDVCWLKEINEVRKLAGLSLLDEYSMEIIMEELETQCHENLQLAIQTKEGLGIEYDEDVVCDVCRMPDCEEENEMVFCDGCNLCVHQACYGILKVPKGNWMCKLCTLGIRGSAVCILCNRKGGAMKSTRSGNKWAHVICALWIPEISIADPERMEPITKVSHIPSSRWALVCSICKEKVGACIQCSVKHCVTAYHVTCAVEAKLDMMTDCTTATSDDDAVIFRSYCKKHSKNRKESDSEDEKTSDEKRSQRHHRIMEVEEEFFTLVKPTAVENSLSVPLETAEQVMVYWKLKRKANFNKPLITPKHKEDTALAEAAETNLQRRLRMFTHLRQDLERVRNLCYMIGRREKTKRATVKNMESVFLTQMKLLERRMNHESSFDTVRMVPALQKFGKPDVCELARKESVLLSKAMQWPQQAEGSSQSASPTELQHVEEDVIASKNDKEEKSSNVSAEITHEDISRQESLLSTTKHKNGLIRKAFVSACQKRKALLRKDNGKCNVDRALPEQDSPHGLPSRKRTFNGSSDSDFERENHKPPEKTNISKKSRLTKAQSWVAWRASGAAMSPSSYTVKTDKVPETEGKSNAAADLSTKSSSGRRTRSSSVLSDAPPNRLSGDSLQVNPVDVKDAKQETKRKASKEVASFNSESHLIVKWDSDKSDNPSIMEKPNVVSKQKDIASIRRKNSKRDRTDNQRSGDSSSDQASVRHGTRSNGAVAVSKREHPVQTPADRPPRRAAASKAKNVSGALARSCERGSLDADEKKAAFSEQGLRKQIHVQPKENVPLSPEMEASSEPLAHSPRGSRVMSSIDNLPKDEEDGGYRGDMDETDSETLGPSRRKSHQTVHRLSHEAISNRLSETGDSSQSEHQKFPSKKRRLKVVRTRRRTGDSSLVSFKGFKDLEDQSLSSPSSQGQRVASPLSSDQKQDRPKNEQAAGDICDENTAVKTPFAGGQTNVSEEPKPISNTTCETNHTDDLPEQYQLSSSFSYLSAYMQNQALFQAGPMMNVPFMTPQGYFYQTVPNYPFPVWPPPPPPPPPPDSDEERFTLGPSVKSTGVSPPHPLPDSTLSPDSQQQSVFSVAIQASAEKSENLAVPHGSPSMPSTGMLPAVRTVTTMGGEEESVEASLVKKKKKKSKKKKKKKKKRKRKHSQSDYPSTLDSDSDNSSYASSNYDEYCVEYCSTLDEAAAQLQNDTTQLPLAIDEEPIVSDAQTLENSHSKPTASTAPVTSPCSPSHVSGESKLLLKIDKKKIVASQDSESSSSSLEDDSRFDNESKGHILPLKLKLCAQKSDRTLRGGLVAREYQILDPGESCTTEQKPLVTDTTDTTTVHRAQAALRRLGLTTDKKGDIAQKRPLRSDTSKSTVVKKTSIDATSAKPGSTAHEKLSLSEHKKTNSKKKPPAANTASKTDTLLNKSLRTSATSALLNNNYRSNRGTTQPSLAGGNLSAANPIPQRERHWKKLKLDVHEASVSSDIKLNKTADSNISADQKVLKSPKGSGTVSPEKRQTTTPPTVKPEKSVPTSLAVSGSAPSPIKPRLHGGDSVPKKTEKIENSTSQLPTKVSKPGRRKPVDVGKSTLVKSFRSSTTVGLPPVSPYKFTVSNTHQQKMATGPFSNAPQGKVKSLSKSTAAKDEKHPDESKPLHDDPYEFAEFSL